MKLYVLVRKDLSRSQQAVQAIHAATEHIHQMTINEMGDPWEGPFGPTVALLLVEDGSALEAWQARLGDAATTFYEPDLGDIPTALAYYGEDTVGFSELRLA